MGWTRVDVKIPEEGSWVALIEVDDEGRINPLGYVERDVLESAREPLAETVEREAVEGCEDGEAHLRRRDLVHFLGTIGN